MKKEAYFRRVIFIFYIDPKITFFYITAAVRCFLTDWIKSGAPSIVITNSPSSSDKIILFAFDCLSKLFAPFSSLPHRSAAKRRFTIFKLLYRNVLCPTNQSNPCGNVRFFLPLKITFLSILGRLTEGRLTTTRFNSMEMFSIKPIFSGNNNNMYYIFSALRLFSQQFSSLCGSIFCIHRPQSIDSVIKISCWNIFPKKENFKFIFIRGEIFGWKRKRRFASPILSNGLFSLSAGEFSWPVLIFNQLRLLRSLFTTWELPQTWERDRQ